MEMSGQLDTPVTLLREKSPIHINWGVGEGWGGIGRSVGLMVLEEKKCVAPAGV